MREFNEYEKEVYGIKDEVVADAVVEDTVVEDKPIEDVIVEDKPIVEDVIVEDKPIVVEDKPVVETPTPEYKSKKFIEVEDEAALFAKLQAKYGHTTLSNEEKAIAYLRARNPELEDKDIAFLAETEYGIGAEAIPDDELDDSQRRELQKQEIARKRLTKQADNYFAEQANQVALPDYDPLELDPEYKAFRGQVQAQEAEQAARQAHITDVHTQIDTNVKAIAEITESVEIELDEGKLAVPVKFKLNEDKQKELADFSKRYTPTQAEYDAFNNPETGKFDYKGYMEWLAPIAFAKDIAKAGMRQALAQDRQQFIEKELKNSTLRNNEVSQTVERKVDPIDYYFDNIAGR